MRTLLPILLLALAAGALLVLVLGQREAPLTGEGAGGGGVALDRPAPAGGSEELSVEPAAVEIVGDEHWPATLVADDPEDLPRTRFPRYGQSRPILPNGEEPWPATGALVLDILKRELGGRGVALRFKNPAELEAFRSSKWGQPLPPGIFAHDLLGHLVEIGFQPVMRPEAIYMVRFGKP